jgi:hypothetical protein
VADGRYLPVVRDHQAGNDDIRPRVEWWSNAALISWRKSQVNGVSTAWTKPPQSVPWDTPKTNPPTGMQNTKLMITGSNRRRVFIVSNGVKLDHGFGRRKWRLKVTN